MDAKEKEALREKIKEEIVKIEKAIVPLLDATKPISPENSIGRVSRMDAINNKGVAEAALRSAKTNLSKLQIALTKIDNPDFGNCSINETSGVRQQIAFVVREQHMSCDF